MRKVSPKLEQWLIDFNKLLERLLKNGFKATPTNAREGLAKMTSRLIKDIPDIACIRDDMIHSPRYDVPVRIYHPAPETKLPVLVYFHGGGHMGGSITVYDPICRKMAIATKHIIVAPDYRLAPECPYPAGVNDAYNTVKGVWKVLDGQDISYIPKLSIAGDSAGGALCATLAHTAQHDAGLDIRRQAMIYPSLDYTINLDSVENNARGFLLEKDKILWYFDNYFQNGENRKTASPLYMDFTNRLPETLVITAEFCPLRDEGIAYTNKIKAAGIYAENLHFKDMIHAFMNMENLVMDECNTVYKKINEFLNRP